MAARRAARSVMLPAASRLFLPFPALYATGMYTGRYAECSSRAHAVADAEGSNEGERYASAGRPPRPPPRRPRTQRRAAARVMARARCRRGCRCQCAERRAPSFSSPPRVAYMPADIDLRLMSEDDARAVRCLPPFRPSPFAATAVFMSPIDIRDDE